MKRSKKTLVVFLILLAVAAGLSLGLKQRQFSVSVPKGFGFGAPNNQTSVRADGMYSITYFGYPSPYKVREAFRPTNDEFNTLSYETVPLNWFFVASNTVFWMALLTLPLLLVLLYRSSRTKRGATEATLPPSRPQEKHANTRD